VSPGFFDAFEIPLLAGRTFTAGDPNVVAKRAVGDRRVRTVSGKVQQIAVPNNVGAADGVRATAVVVNRSFAETVLGARDVLGRRVP
jgi:hypothetical protein